MGVDPDQALDEAIRIPTTPAWKARNSREQFWRFICAQIAASGTPRAATTPSPKNCLPDSTSTRSLEYESERAGTFEPLRFVPPGKTVVLGLVSSKVAELESEDQLARRIEEASKYVPLENLAISPQCGFASTMEGNLLTEDQQWLKLKLVIDTARQVWGTV